MITLILEVATKEADVSKYIKLLDASDNLVVMCRAESTIEAYNEAIKSADQSSDILFLSDNAVISDGFIDNMKHCLQAAEKHAIVCAQEVSDKNGEAIKTLLPEYSVSKLPSTHCALVKRKVINLFGYFDTGYETLLYTLIDFHFKVNVFGFSTIISHFAMFHREKTEREYDYAHDRGLLSKKYAYSEDLLLQNDNCAEHSCLKFGEILIEDDSQKKKILFDCIIMPPEHCGTSEYQISLFEAFYGLFKDKYDIYLHITPAADKYFGLSEKYENIVYPDTISGVFHLGFAPNQLMYMPAQFTLSKHCLKIVQTMFDIMMARIDEHNGVKISGVELGIDISDGIIFISNFGRDDFDAYFKVKKPTKVIYPATNLSRTQNNDYDLPFDDYFLIIGNHFKHKAIKEVLAAISGSEYNFIVVGCGDNEYIEKNIYGYQSGQLDADFLSYLYMKCTAVVFPSQYEGFGLPLAISLKNKKRIIACNNDINNELASHFHEFRDYFILFDNYSQIAKIISETDFSKELPPAEYEDSWDNVAIEVETFFEEILSEKPDVNKLIERQRLFNILEINHKEYTGHIQHIEKEHNKLAMHHAELMRQSDELIRQNNAITRSVSYRLNRKIMSCAIIRRIYLMLKKVIKTLARR